MKKRWISTILIFLLCFNMNVFAVGTEVFDISNQFNDLSLDELINKYSKLDYLENYPDDRFELALKIVEKIKSQSNKDDYLKKLSDVVFSYAETNKSVMDYNLGIEISKEFSSNELSKEYRKKFDDNRTKLLDEEEALDGPIYGDVVEETDYEVSNPITETDGNQGNDSSESSSEDFPSDAVYSEVEIVRENNSYYRVTIYYDPNGKVVKTDKIKVTDSYINEEFGYANNGEANVQYPQHNDSFPGDNVDANTPDSPPIYNPDGDLIAIKNGEDSYTLNTYKLLYSKDKYRRNPQYQDLGLKVVGETITYDQLAKILENISNRKHAYFMKEKEHFTAIIDGSTYHYAKNDTISISELQTLFYEVDFTIKAKVSSSVKYDTEHPEGEVIEFPNIIFQSEKKYNFSIDGIEFDNTQLINSEGTLMFPIKSIAKGLGYEIFDNNNELRLVKEETVITYVVNDNKLIKNNTDYIVSSDSFKGATGEIFGVLDLNLFGLDYQADIVNVDGITTVNYSN